jgi:hypothetical protein
MDLRHVWRIKARRHRSHHHRSVQDCGEGVARIVACSGGDHSLHRDVLFNVSLLLLMLSAVILAVAIIFMCSSPFHSKNITYEEEDEYGHRRIVFGHAVCSATQCYQIALADKAPDDGWLRAG